MSQSKLHSFYEALIGTAVGYCVAVSLQAVVYPHYGFDPVATVHLEIAAVFTAASVIRGYGMRRVFNWLYKRGILRAKTS